MTIFAGCWDKTTWSWDTSSQEARHRYRGHTDFVKSVITARIPNPSDDKFSPSRKPSQDILITGSADMTVNIYDVKSGDKLMVLKGSTRGILFLTIDPTSLEVLLEPTDSPITNKEHIFSLLVSSSAPTILQYCVPVGPLFQPTPQPITLHPTEPPISIHETSVTTLHFTNDNSSTSSLSSPFPFDPPDLYTASLDGNAHVVARPASTDPIKDSETNAQIASWGSSPPDITLTITHKPPNPQILTLTTHSTNQDTWIITAGRDEDIHIWSNTTGVLIGKYKGHFDEVTCLAIIESSSTSSSSSNPNGKQAAANGPEQPNEKQKPKKQEYKLVSGGLDGTIRCWSLNHEDLERSLIQKLDEDDDDAEGNEESNKTKGVETTEEEEAELEALMAED